MPPLRERRSEIVLLARRFLAQSAGEGSPAPQVAPETVAVLERYRWPGNVRELRNAIERAALLAGGAPITPSHLPRKLLDALAQCDGNQTRAAELLGVSRRTLTNRLEEYAIERPRKKI